jgi:hypothetical protein
LPPNLSRQALVGVMVTGAVALAACDDRSSGLASEPRRSEAVPDAVLSCGDRVEGAPGLPTVERRDDVVVGSVVFDGLRGEARRARERPWEPAERYHNGEGAVKVLAGVRAGVRTTVAVAPSSRGVVGFAYGPSTDPRDPRDSLDESEWVVEFRACPQNEPRFDGGGSVGRRTWFAGGLLVSKAHCLELLARERRGPARRYQLAFGVPAKSC